MIRALLILLSVLYLSGCDSSTPVVGNEQIIAGAANPTIDTNGNSSTNPSDNTELEIPESLIEGNITLVNDSLPTGDILVQVRGTQIRTNRQFIGDYSLKIPSSDTERTMVLDITGENIVNHGVTVQVPAHAQLVVMDATVTASTPPITFNLERGGKLKNEGSPTRTSVSVPANAFQFSDGTIATGDAQISITEIDITDLHGDSSWAPNLIGIAEGMSEPSAIVTFGMSDFQFSQDGRELDLRAGVEATIEMDLVSPYIMSDEVSVLIEATDGVVMPLWHYDTVDMVWKEEGETLIVADEESESGFSSTGQVSHFTTWNLDFVTPSMDGIINVRVVDECGAIRSDQVVNGYSMTVRIPPEDGPGHGGTPSWSNTKSMTPQDNTIQVLANSSQRQHYIDTNLANTTGWTTMDILPNSVVVNGADLVDHGLTPINYLFKNYEGNNTVTFDVVMPNECNPPEEPPPEEPPPEEPPPEEPPPEEPPPEEPPEPVEVTASINIILVDIDGRTRNDVAVLSYNATVNTLESSWQNSGSLTPASNSLTVQANTQELIDANLFVTTEISVDSIVLDGSYRTGEEPGPLIRLFTDFEGENTVNFRYVVMPE
ncbi:hypothetical protein N9850_01000 [Granulosicoccus sp.]|nr:hypothetical protein [Granulosicoccus sp.]